MAKKKTSLSLHKAAQILGKRSGTVRRRYSIRRYRRSGKF